MLPWCCSGLLLCMSTFEFCVQARQQPWLLRNRCLDLAALSFQEGPLHVPTRPSRSLPPSILLLAAFAWEPIIDCSSLYRLAYLPMFCICRWWFSNCLRANTVCRNRLWYSRVQETKREPIPLHTIYLYCPLRKTHFILIGT